jgi:hypothetical protein
MDDYDARLVELYDDDNPDGSDPHFYRRVADEDRREPSSIQAAAQAY